MNPILLSALADVAVDLYRRFMDSPSEQEIAAEEESEGPQTWEEAYAQIAAYVEEQNKVDEEQSALIVKIAEKVDAVAEEQQRLSARLDAHLASARRTQMFSVFGAICGVTALVVVLLK